MTAPSFRSVGGDVVWGTTKLSREDCDWLLETFREEHKAARASKAYAIASRAFELHTALFEAVNQQRDWQRASGALQHRRAS